MRVHLNTSFDGFYFCLSTTKNDYVNFRFIHRQKLLCISMWKLEMDTWKIVNCGIIIMVKNYGLLIIAWKESLYIEMERLDIVWILFDKINPLSVPSLTFELFKICTCCLETMGDGSIIDFTVAFLWCPQRMAFPRYCMVRGGGFYFDRNVFWKSLPFLRSSLSWAKIPLWFSHLNCKSSSQQEQLFYHSSSRDQSFSINSLMLEIPLK